MMQAAVTYGQEELRKNVVGFIETHTKVRKNIANSKSINFFKNFYKYLKYIFFVINGSYA